jgi:hypothetical protein
VPELTNSRVVCCYLARRARWPGELPRFGSKSESEKKHLLVVSTARISRLQQASIMLRKRDWNQLQGLLMPREAKKTRSVAIRNITPNSSPEGRPVELTWRLVEASSNDKFTLYGYKPSLELVTWSGRSWHR